MSLLYSSNQKKNLAFFFFQNAQPRHVSLSDLVIEKDANGSKILAMTLLPEKSMG